MDLSRLEAVLAYQRYVRNQGYIAALIGIGTALFLEGVAAASWWAWRFILVHTWPTAPSWPFWTVHVCGVMAAILVLWVTWSQFQEHAHCGSNRWKYECAVRYVPETLFYGTWQTILLPVFIVIGAGYLMFIEAPMAIKEAFIRFRQRRKRVSPAPAASP